MPENEYSNVPPEEIFLLIAQHNLLARTHKGSVKAEEHQACKTGIEEIIRRVPGSVSNTFKAMFDAGTGVGCEACRDVFKYAIAIYYYKPGADKIIKEIEKKYNTYVAGCRHGPG